MTDRPAIFVVDDDPGVRDFVRVLLEFAGFTDIRSYQSSRKFLDEAPVRNGDCVLLDVRMPEIDGLGVQKELNRRGKRVGVIIMTAHAEVPMAVQAMRDGAVDFIEKPFSNETLLASVHRGLNVAKGSEHALTKSDDILRRLEQLTPREREVFDRIVQGWPNKVIAHDLRISQRTVEMHRARVMEKMKAQNLARLIRMTIDMGISLGGKEDRRTEQ
jgi:FixJ family two-component response regulator